MKKIIILAIVALAVQVRAYTITNINTALTTNYTQLAGVINQNNNNFVAWLNSHDASNVVHDARFTSDEAVVAALTTAFNNYVATNSGGGGGGTNSVSIAVTNPVALPYGSAPTVTNLGTSLVGVFQFGIPSGAPGTNFVTVNQFTNVFLSSFESITFQTNYAYWHASNFLARVNGFYKGSIAGGDDGGNPPQSYNGDYFVASFSGTNGWFVVTNGFQTASNISIAVVSTNPVPANPGAATLYTVDHYELLGRTNGFFGQYVRFNSPVDPNDAATKSYADTLFQNSFNNNWSTYTSNGVYHAVYSYQNFTVMDFAGTTVWIPITGSALSGTNFTLTTAATNLNNGVLLQMSTNLALTAAFHTITNWTTNTVSGVTTFTTPLSPAIPVAFYRLISSSSSSSSSIFTPLALTQGALYPSNTWSLATITNGMKAGDIITVNSNGLKLVDVWLSNSTPILKPHW